MKVTGTINADDLKAIWDYSDPDHAFKDYIEYLNLSGATLDGMTAFPPGQFAGSALEEILLPSGMLAIGDNAFQNCAALTQVSLPNTLTSIGDFAFSGCTSLKSIDLSACTGMTTISNGAFHNCSGLESITLPESLTSIGNSSVFTGCTGLSEIHFPADFSTLKYTAVFSSAGSQPNFDGLAVHLHKPDGVVGVDEMTFLNAANIKIYVPAQLIDEYAADSGWQYWTQTVGNVALVFENAQRPIISNHPQGASIIQGQTHAMNVAANVLDGGSLSYQWYKDGQAIGGATGESYTTPSNLPLGSHSYHVVVTNTSNNAVVEKISTATSNTATVTVNAIPTYAITVLSAGTGATGGGSYEAGATVTISAGTAPTGMRFKNWTTASLGVTFADSTSSTTTFPMPGHAVGVTANFESIPATVTGVTVSPVTVTVQKGTTYQFSATVQGTNNPGQGVTWSVSPNTNGSSIAADGTLTLGAGETAATLSVKATSTMDGTKSGTAIVTVSDDAPPTPTVSTVTVTPAAITLNKGDSYTFSASVAGANNPSQGVTWTVTGGASGTSIINGKLTVAANETASTLTVKATSTVDTSKSGTATVTVAQPVTTHTITFDANGGSVSPTSMQTGADGKLASLPTPARSNYSFNGWFTATSSGTQVTTSTVFSESKTIYAQWTYQSSGGPSSGGGTITPPSDKIAAPTTVAGWTDAAEKVNDLKDGTAFTIDMSKNTTVSGDFLEAVAGKDAEITFDMGGGMTWTVNGTDIPKGVDLAALNLGVSTGTTFVPAEVRGIDGSISEVQLRLSHNGELPFAMTLSVKLDKANAGYFANLYYYNEATGALEFQSAVKIGTDGAAEFVFDHASDYLIVVAETSLAPEIWQNPFNDVSANHWFYDAVQYAHENGIMNGTSTTTFAPNTNLSRAMMVQILWNLEGRPAAGSASFTDVASTAWYADAVAWTASNSIVSGYGNDKFGPEESITREQMATILYRYCAYKEIELPSTRTGDFADSTAIGTWAVEAVNAMYEAEVLNGKGSNTFDPKGTATRAEIAQMMKNFMETVK
ncbi:S-layer homology domain-containing protein [Oscillospiraceae bacterium OttesenSCG-928-G22]|nr:S-layer homology domain-containing protein [Oscillospiraceae bacterium OttesenSCG-928-G22]